MTESQDTKSPLQRAAEDLFNFAIAREDTKWLLARLPAEAAVKPATVAYELQILKIISVGWSIAYFLEEWPQKDALAASFWDGVRTFSGSLSTTTGLMTGQDIDYFHTLKDRLDVYVEALRRDPAAKNPAEVIGLEFARTCGGPENLFIVFIGGRMFSEATSRVREYLDTLDLQAIGTGGVSLQ